jgi:hypothetical protein
MSDLTGKKSMFQKEREPDRAYFAFLLWSIQDNSFRTNRELSRVMDCSEGSIRYWKKKFRWSARIKSSIDSEYVALEIYRERISFERSESLRKQMAKGLEMILGNAPASLRTYVRREVVGFPTMLDSMDKKEVTRELQLGKKKETPDTERNLHQKIREKYLTEDSIGRQIKLIDATMGMIAGKIKDGTLKVSVSDIPSLIKARALLTGVPTQHIHVTNEHELTIKETPRVMHLKSTGGSEMDVLGAMEEDVKELSVILEAVRESKNQGVRDKERRVVEIDSDGTIRSIEDE